MNRGEIVKVDANVYGPDLIQSVRGQGCNSVESSVSKWLPVIFSSSNVALDLRRKFFFQ